MRGPHPISLILLHPTVDGFIVTRKYVSRNRQNGYCCHRPFSGGTMVDIDHNLIHEALRLTTAVNVHRIRTLIICYQEAIQRQDDGRNYDRRCEEALRGFVAATHQAKLANLKAEQ